MSAMHESGSAESVMPVCLRSRTPDLNPGTGDRIAPRSQFGNVDQKEKIHCVGLQTNSRGGEGYGYFSCPDDTPYP